MPDKDDSQSKSLGVKLVPTAGNSWFIVGGSDGDSGAGGGLGGAVFLHAKTITEVPSKSKGLHLLRKGFHILLKILLGRNLAVVRVHLLSSRMTEGADILLPLYNEHKMSVIKCRQREKNKRFYAEESSIASLPGLALVGCFLLELQLLALLRLLALRVRCRYLPCWGLPWAVAEQAGRGSAL